MKKSNAKLILPYQYSIYALVQRIPQNVTIQFIYQHEKRYVNRAVKL